MVEICGWISALCFVFCYIPQIIRTHRLKSVDDISIWLFILCVIAYSAGIIYGVGLNQVPLIFNYTVGLLLATIIVWQYYIYRDPRKDHIRQTVADFLQDVRRKLK